MEKLVEGKTICTELEIIWFTISEMIADLINKGVEIPHQARVSMEGAKILVNLCKYHPKLAHDIGPTTLDSVQGFCVSCCGADIVARISCELRNLQDLMVIKAVNAVGSDYAMQWQTKIENHWVDVGKLIGPICTINERAGQ